MAERLINPLKWHGGKFYLARRINALMPPHVHYVEPFAGGLSVLLAYIGSGRSELINDIDGELMNFWRVLKNRPQFCDFYNLAIATPFSRIEFDESLPSSGDSPAIRAGKFFVRCRQSLAGRQENFAVPVRNRTRLGINDNVSAWLGAVEGLPAVHQRLQSVFIESMDAVELIAREDTPNTLQYLDPPYLHETRVSPNVYRHEMTALEHRQLLLTCLACRGKIMLSGYRSELYDSMLTGWKRHDWDMPNHAGHGEILTLVTECLWCNF